MWSHLFLTIMGINEAMLAPTHNEYANESRKSSQVDSEFHLQKPCHNLSLLTYMEPRAAIPGLAFPDPSTRRLSAQLDPSPAFPIQAGSQ